MRKYLTTALAIALMSGVSYADLQNLEVDASLRIRGNSFYNVYSSEDNSANQYTEQRTAIEMMADFSDEVSANITLSRYGHWGDAGVNDDADVRLHEAYITLGEALFGFSSKIGRQELLLGSEFLVGNNNTGSGFDHFSYDGIVSTYSNDTYDVTLLNLKIDEVDGFDASEVDEDTDLRGIYGTYKGIENHTIDGYVLNRRTGVAGADNDELYTIGARAAGAFSGAFSFFNGTAIDYEIEIATQGGDMADDTIDYEGDAIAAELGYTFDFSNQMRMYIGGALFTGPDDGEAGFDRMFSDHEYSEFLGDGDMSNVLILRGGVSAYASEKIQLSAVVSSFTLDAEYAVATIYNGAVAVAADEDDLGTEIGLYANYQYSEDVALEVGAATLLNGDAIEDAVGGNEDDPIYVYAEISLGF